MARAIRKLSINFGMVSVPVGVYTAVDDHDLKFGLYHAGCSGKVGNVRTCEGCGNEVEWADIAKGAVSESGVLVIADPEEIKSLEGEQPLGIEVSEFVLADEIDPIRYEQPYYLAPDKTGKQGYELLRQALVESGKVGVVRFALRGRESEAVLRPCGKLLVLHRLAWSDEIRDTADLPNLDKPVQIKPEMLEMAHVLINAMTATYVPEDHVDRHTERLREFVETKAAGGDFEYKPAAPEPAVDDLLAALEASVKKKGKKGKAA